ncbi:MAG: ATP-binding protein, partial [Planctomycetes bacterium]|nr:ATP-binding protein [Planctomycetota bacterium]
DLAQEIDNLVTLCAHSSNKASNSRERFDLGHEIELRMPREFRRAQLRAVRIELSLEGDLSMVGDREALLLMVRNLVGNAVSFSPPEGLVRMSVEGLEREIVLAVEDQGPGVELANRTRIFQPFQRGSDRPGKRAGFGLGLALSQEAVQAQGGLLAVSDSELGGARFTARFPRQTPGSIGSVPRG